MNEASRIGPRAAGSFRSDSVEQNRKQDRQQEESRQHRQSGLEIDCDMSPELACVPFDQRRAEKQCRDCAEPEKDSEGKQHLHVSLALPRHQQDADHRPVNTPTKIVRIVSRQPR